MARWFKMKKKNSYKEIDKIKKELKLAKEKAEEYLKNWQRSQADYLNLKRRVEEEKKEMISSANIDLILQILPVLDNFRRAFQHIPSKFKDDDWVMGIKHLERQLENVLKNEGLERINTEGTVFNPHLHEAILLEKKPGVKKGTILEELEAGYKIRDRVIKAAKVKVAK